MPLAKGSSCVSSEPIRTGIRDTPHLQATGGEGDTSSLLELWATGDWTQGRHVTVRPLSVFLLGVWSWASEHPEQALRLSGVRQCWCMGEQRQAEGGER